MRRSLLPREVDLGLVFISPSWAERAEEIVDVLRSSVGVPCLAGCVANGVIANQWEFEQKGGIALGLYRLPGARIECLPFSAQRAQEAIGSEDKRYWRRLLDPGAAGINGWVVFVEPLQIDVEAWLRSWDTSFPGKRIFGACLSDCSGRGSRLFGQLHHDSKAVYSLVEPNGMAGFFGNGEFGPVGGKNFVHGYTASVAVFTER